MGKKEALIENHTYSLKKPGVYEVSAVAEFSLHFGDGESKTYKMETVWEKIEVIK
ncbi:hypothetical protein D3C71_1946680 [compost metagenome]